MEEIGCGSPLWSIAQSPSTSPGRVELKRTLRRCLMCLSSPVQTSVHFPLPFHLCRVVNSPPTSSLTATSWPLPQLHFDQQLLNPPLPSWISPHPWLSAPLPSCGSHPLLSAHLASLLSGETAGRTFIPSASLLHCASCFPAGGSSLYWALPDPISLPRIPGVPFSSSHPLFTSFQKVLFLSLHP